MRITLLLLVSCLVTPVAAAKTLNVAMYGVDSVACGAANAPCRTIGRAVANALTGDAVLVGPGYYGDANRDGDLADPEDEPGLLETVCECVVNVGKRITLRSRDGAGSTVIDARGITRWGISVYGASGATIGGPGAGFTVRGAQDAGIHVGGIVMKANRVIGNVADKNLGSGFAIYADDTLVSGNRAFDNAEHGFDVEAQGARLTGNGASGNAMHGFVFVGSVDARINRSIASGNLQMGFVVANGDAQLDAVAAVGNGLDGVYFENADGRVTRSTILGNGNATGSNCGVGNQTGHEIVATGNYWGSQNGPGPDPADDQCLGDGSPLRLDPVRRSEMEIKLPPLR